MWLIFAFLSAIFASLTAILAKCGIRKTDSSVATAIRTIVVLLFSLIMVKVTGSSVPQEGIAMRVWLFLILSGISTGASWLCYFKALSIGPASKVAVLDKSSTVLTMILSLIIFSEPFGALSIVAIALVALGTYIMIEKKESDRVETNRSWVIYAALAAIFASLTTILGKAGVEGIDSNIGSSIRTFVVLIMAWIVVFATKKGEGVKHIDRKELLFILLSGIATGASWLCYYRALQDGLASIVVSIDRLSLLFTVLFSYFVFKEKQSMKAILGLALLTCGTFLLLIPVLS